MACDGPSGLDLVTRRIELIKESVRVVSNYKIIFIDFNMPQMPGTKVARKIKKLCTDAQVKLPKMFCCSADYNSPEFRKAVRDAGMKTAISKPISYQKLK